MDETAKHCPLLLAAAEVKSDPYASTFCHGEQCAWWHCAHDVITGASTGSCALLHISGSLDSIDRYGIPN